MIWQCMHYNAKIQLLKIKIDIYNMGITAILYRTVINILHMEDAYNVLLGII